MSNYHSQTKRAPEGYSLLGLSITMGIFMIQSSVYFGMAYKSEYYTVHWSGRGFLVAKTTNCDLCRKRLYCIIIRIKYMCYKNGHSIDYNDNNDIFNVIEW